VSGYANAVGRLSAFSIDKTGVEYRRRTVQQHSSTERLAMPLSHKHSARHCWVQLNAASVVYGLVKDNQPDTRKLPSSPYLGDMVRLLSGIFVSFLIFLALLIDYLLNLTPAHGKMSPLISISWWVQLFARLPRVEQSVAK
jgi:hypothetical protein